MGVKWLIIATANVKTSGECYLLYYLINVSFCELLGPPFWRREAVFKRHWDLHPIEKQLLLSSWSSSSSSSPCGASTSFRHSSTYYSYFGDTRPSINSIN